MPAQKNCRRCDTSLFSNRHNGGSCEQRTTRAAQGAVRGNMDALLFAKVDNLLLRKRGVVFDLVDRRDDRHVRQKLLEKWLAVVRDPNGLDLARSQELFHALPGGYVGVRVVNVAGAILELWEKGVVPCRLLDSACTRENRQFRTYHWGSWPMASGQGKDPDSPNPASSDWCPKPPRRGCGMYTTAWW